MNAFITKVFKSAGIEAKVSKDTKNPRFRVKDNKLTLEGTVKDNKYSMKIVDNTGRSIDSLTVRVDNTNDVANRINESINTLRMLSKVYDQHKLVEEDEEFDTVSVDDDVAEGPTSLTDGLQELYEKIMEVAEFSETLSDLVTDDDAETFSTLISFSSSLYDTALDVDDYLEDLLPDEEDDDVDESIRKKPSKSDLQKVLSNLTMAESIIRKNTKVSDIRKALKDIKSEIIARGF